MSNNALMMAIIATLRPVPAATGIVPVGSTAISGAIIIGSSGSGAHTCELPAEGLPGDTVILTCNAMNSRNFAWSAPAGTVVMPSTILASGTVAAIYVITLTQGNVDAGNVAAPCTALANSSVPASATVDVYRGVAAVPLDAVSVLANDTFPSAPSASVVVPGVMPTTDGSLLQYAVFTSLPTGYISSAPPAGWMPGAAQVAVNGKPCPTGYTVQKTAANTGFVPVTIATNNGNLSGAYSTMQFALRPYNPTFRLLGTLPAGTVGSAYTGTLTLAGDFTAPVTITGLPAWMSYTISDKTASITGTPTTAQTYSFTPVATDAASKTATGSAQSVVVSAAATSPTIVQIATATTGTGAAASTRTVTLDNAPTPGNALVAILGYYQVPSGASSSAPDGTWTEWPAGELRGINAFIHPVVTGNGKSYTFTLSVARNFGVALYEIAGSNGVITAANSKSNSGGSVISLPADAGNALAIGVLKQSSQPAGGSDANAGWTKDAYIAQNNGSLAFWHATTVAGVDTTLTATGPTTGAIGMLIVGRAP